MIDVSFESEFNFKIMSSKIFNCKILKLIKLEFKLGSFNICARKFDSYLYIIIIIINKVSIFREIEKISTTAMMNANRLSFDFY